VAINISLRILLSNQTIIFCIRWFYKNILGRILKANKLSLIKVNKSIGNIPGEAVMTKEQSINLIKKNGVQFNLYTLQYMLALWVTCTMMHFEVNGFLTAFVSMGIMLFGVWNVLPSKMSRSAYLAHMKFRIIAMTIIWFVSLGSMSLADYLV
jgi:hypothetical protein